MDDHIIMFKENTPKDEINNFVKDVESKGGKLKSHLDIINGISVSVPKDHINALSEHPIVHSTEKDGKVTTQS